jgi:hypothetical protein
LRSVKLFDTSNTRSGAFDFASLLIDIKKDGHEVTNGVYGTAEDYKRFRIEKSGAGPSSNGHGNIGSSVGIESIMECSAAEDKPSSSSSRMAEI